MTAQVCPRCGQPLSTRYGVALSPMRLRLFDLIEHRPGITSQQMATALYPGRDLKTARRTLYTHIVHTNEILESTDIRIVRLDGGYRLAELKTPNICRTSAQCDRIHTSAPTKGKANDVHGTLRKDELSQR
jgi:hypothetical protein